MIVTSEEFLRQRSSEVDLQEGHKIADQLEAELCKSEIGVGLSAPQIGILARVVVLKYPPDGIKRFINPKIVEKKNPYINKNEGCLSFPGKWLTTIRYHSVTVEDDFHGTTELNNFSSLITQHEVDHLNGILFFDRQVPDPYEPCFCGGQKKFKFCCFQKVR